MIKIFFRFSLFVFLFHFNSAAQVKEHLTNDIKHFFNVGGEIYSAPLNYDKQDWLNFSSVLGLTTASYFADETVRAFVQKHRADFLNSAASMDDYFFYFSAAAMTTSYLYGLIGKDNYARNLGLQLGEAMFYTGVTTFLFKVSFGRSRPYRNEGNHEFDFFQFDDSKQSFASGHAAISFAFSTVVAGQKESFFWKAAWMTAAGLVASARIYNDKHWLSDVIMGSSIGYFFGRFVVDAHKNELQSPTEIIPLPIINLSISF